MNPLISPTKPKPVPQQQRPRFTLTAPTDLLILIGLVGTVVCVLAAPLTFLADLLWSLQLFHLWAQISATFVGFLLLAAVITVQSSGWTRGLLLLGATLLWGAVIDSIDGTQDILPLVVMALAAWGMLFAIETRGITLALNRYSVLHWLGCLAGVLATGLYMGSAVYYFGMNLTQGPLDYNRHPLYAFGIIIAGALRLIRTTMERPSAR